MQYHIPLFNFSSNTHPFPVDIHMVGLLILVICCGKITHACLEHTHLAVLTQLQSGTSALTVTLVFISAS